MQFQLKKGLSLKIIKKFLLNIEFRVYLCIKYSIRGYYNAKRRDF